MDTYRDPEPILNSIPLLHAVLCADCEIISDSAGEVCGVCGSRSLLNLGRILGGSVGEERALVLPEEEGKARRRFTLFINRDAVRHLQPWRQNRTERAKKSGS
jgi:hypothetical protein